MKHLSILVPAGEPNLSSIVGPYKFFLKANEYFRMKKRKPVFSVQLVGCLKRTDIYGGLFSIHPQINYRDVETTDLIIIPATREELQLHLQKNKNLGKWIARQYAQGAEIASICTGAFLLASTGLMKGRQCSTHWMAADKFRQLFPDVVLVEDLLITEDNGIFTNGGGFSFLNLLLHLVGKYYDRETAIYCSKLFEIDLERHLQSPFIIFSGQKRHGDEAIRKAQLYMEGNPGEDISVEGLAARFGLGRRTFDRRFRQATANSPAEYLQRVRVEAAKKMLEMGRETISEVMYTVGYSDGRAFRSTFKRIAGMSPVAYRHRYRRALMGAGVGIT